MRALVAAIVGVLGMLMGAAAFVDAQQKAPALKDKVAKWEKDVGAIFDKFDRDKDGMWEPKEWKAGFSAINRAVGGLHVATAALQQTYATMPRPGIGNASTKEALFVPPANPYASKEGESFSPEQMNGKDSGPDGPKRRISKQTFIQHYVSQITHLDALHAHLFKLVEARQKQLEKLKNQRR